ncbi:MAG: 50S ribosomal protein L18e [Nanoarchaeota archaeon]
MRMIKPAVSKTKIKKHLRKKTNPDIIETINLAKEQKSWLALAKIISGSTKNYSSINLDEINKQAAAGDIIVIPGKVLGMGEITKKFKISALAFSTSAKEKIKKEKIEYGFIFEEIKKNPSAKGVKILR